MLILCVEAGEEVAAASSAASSATSSAAALSAPSASSTIGGGRGMIMLPKILAASYVRQQHIRTCMHMHALIIMRTVMGGETE